MPKPIKTSRIHEVDDSLKRRHRSLESHPSQVILGNEGRLLNMDITSLHPDPNQPRKNFNPEKLAELSQSIKDKGVLQPIIIRIDSKDNDKCWIVAGERRYRAAMMAGLEKIPTIVTNDNPAEIALIENIQREDLNPVEEAEALAKVMKDFGYTQDQVALVVGKARSTITEVLSLNKLPAEVRAECRTSDIPKSVLLEVAKRGTEEEMVALYNKVKNDDLTVAAIRKLTRPRKAYLRNLPEDLAISKLQEIKKIIGQLDLASVDQAKKELLKQGLADLNEVINNVLV